jgi:hypothetical protein
LSAADWTEGGAEFNLLGPAPMTYRHHLWRAKPPERIDHIRPDQGTLGVCMHNPSKAGAVPSDNDPTMKKVLGFADRWHFSRVDVVNLGDFIATEPKDFYRATRPASLLCDERIREVAERADLFLIAWGALSRPWALARAREVIGIIGRSVVCIGITKDGHPQHPLMAAYVGAPAPFEARP